MSDASLFESLENRSMFATSGFAAPSGLTATPTSATAVQLKRTDNTSNEVAFKIERSTDGTNFSELNILGPNETVYTNGKLKAGVNYSYRVRAMGTGGDSANSNVASVTLGAVTPPPVTTTGSVPVKPGRLKV